MIERFKASGKVNRTATVRNALREVVDDGEAHIGDVARKLQEWGIKVWREPGEAKWVRVDISMTQLRRTLGQIADHTGAGWYSI